MSIRNVSVSLGFKRLFYIVGPNESSFASIDEVPDYVKESFPFFLMLLGLEMAVSLLKGDRKMRLNDGVASLSAGIMSRLPLYVFRSLSLVVYAWVYENWRLTELPWDSAWTWWLAFLAEDCAFYWFHRMAHEVNFMWAFHQVHHSSEDYNLTTALRQPVLQRYTAWVFYLPMALCIPPSVFLVHEQLNLLYQFWIHTQYVKSLGPLEYILNTPSHHRVHHGRNPYCIDKNYAGVLIIWDRIFGTFTQEEEEVAYGLTHSINTFEPVNIQFGYIKPMLRRVWDVRGLGNKLSVLLCGPGWSPGKPRMGLITDIPQVRKPVRTYDTDLNSWVSFYVIFHFFLVMLGNQEFVARKMGFSQTTVLLFIAYLVFSLSSLGRLLDKSSSAAHFEMVRCAVFLLVDIVLCQQGFYGNPGYRPWPVIALHGIFAFSLAVWFAYYLKTKVKVEVKEKST